MLKKAVCGISFAVLVCGLGAQDPFPKIQDLPKEVLYPKHAGVTLDRDGNYLVNGRVRYLFGAQTGENAMAIDLAPTPGYPSELKWMYEEPMNYENMQRIGFDSFALFISARSWLSKYNPEYYRKHQFGVSEKDREYFRIFSNNGLPVLVDYTCFPWTWGSLAGGRQFPNAIPEILINKDRNTGINHWVPYNIFHPDGKKLYLDYWKNGLEQTAAMRGMHKMVYELFNEPGYDDFSAYNRNLFADFLRKKYQTIQNLNRVWNSSYASFQAASAFKRKNENPGLFVDWTKFMEQGMTELARLGADLIRRETGGALVCFQILGRDCYRAIPNSNINIYEINRHMSSISLPTGGGLTPSTSISSAPERSVEAPSGTALAEGILSGRFFRSIADGKPIHNPECYAARTRQGNRNILWQDMLRGANATYMFLWGKRAWDWKPRNTAQGGRRSAEEFAYYLTNPYSFSAESLAGFMDAKQEVFRFGEFFMPRKTGFQSELALLLSFPTERMAVPGGYIGKNEILHYAAGLEFSHFPWEVLVEEQLPEGSASKYKAVIAAGIRNTYPKTLKTLESYVRNGGILIVAREPMPQDEYGHPVKSPLFEGLAIREDDSVPLEKLEFKALLPRTPLLPGEIMVRNTKKVTAARGWEVLATAGKYPALLKRPFGKGFVYLATPQMQDYAVAALLKSVLEPYGIRPMFQITRVPQGDLAVNVEAHGVRRDGLTLTHLMNLDLYPKMLEIRLPEGSSSAADLMSGEVLPVRNGKAMLLLGSNRYTVLGFGSKSSLEKRFGALKPVGGTVLNKRFEAEEKERRKEAEKKNAAAFRFHVDSAMTSPIDLRPFANTGFLDKVAGDGKGGWTDQGAENSLNGTPWEITPLLGVPCDFIRFDQNNDKTCIILKSTSMVRPMPDAVRNIPVNARVRTLFFFHTTAWSSVNTRVMDYIIHYANGKQVTIPVVTGENIGDWWLHGAAKMRNRVAWKNSAGRGFYIFDWRNPEPEEEIRSIDLVSAGGKAIPIILGISAEKLSPSARELNLETGKLASWGGCKAVRSFDCVDIRVNEKTAAWAGLHFNNGKPYPLTEAQMKKAVLKFEVNGGTDPFGNYQGGQSIQISLYANYRGAGPKVFMPKPDGIRETFQSVEIPLSRLLNAKSPYGKIDGVAFQFCGTGNHSGLQIRNLRIEYRD